MAIPVNIYLEILNYYGHTSAITILRLWVHMSIYMGSHSAQIIHNLLLMN